MQTCSAGIHAPASMPPGKALKLGWIMRPGRLPTLEALVEEACSRKVICQVRQASAAHQAPHGNLTLMHAPWLRQLTLAAAALAVADCMWGQHNVSEKLFLKALSGRDKLEEAGREKSWRCKAAAHKAVTCTGVLKK